MAAAAAVLPRPGLALEAVAQARQETLAIGLDIADVVTFDPARLASYTSPLALEAVYDTLVTMLPGHYDEVAPRLATRWERVPEGWRFTLDPAAVFASGKRVTPGDCQWSLERARAVAEGAGQFVANIAAVAVNGPDTIEVRLHRPDEALLQTLASPQFGILERAAVEAQPPPGTEWLNQHSAGSGPYVLVGWSRRQSVRLVANPRSWRGAAMYQRITIFHIPRPVAQLRAIQKGDIDVAFNLIPEQLAVLESDRNVRVDTVRSLDFVYLALTANAAVNSVLAKKEVREAVGAAIDYEDLLGRLLGGNAVRAAHFLPIGVVGSTETVAARVGHHQDLARARALLRQAEIPDGFEIELSYGDEAIAGITYHALARKLQTDLGRVGIKVRLTSLSPIELRDRYLAGKTQAALAFWHSPVIQDRVWAEASVDRVGRRLGWEAPPEVQKLIAAAAGEGDPGKASALWSDFQAAMVEEATVIPLFQPSYQVAIRKSVGSLPLTAAGWMADLGNAKPA